MPRQIALSRADGTFVLDQRLQLERCPKSATLLVEKADKTIDQDASFAAIGCAALRGEPGSKVRDRVEAECKTRKLDCIDYAQWANNMSVYKIGKQW